MDPEDPPQAEKTEEQKLEQKKRAQQEARQKQEEERLKRQEQIKKLNQALKTGLTGLAKTADCQTMCYNKLSLAQKQIQRLYDSILTYKNIRYLDISTNMISQINLIIQFTELVSINASKNQINSLEIFKKPNILTHLQILNLSTNKITKLEQIGLPALRRLNLNQNEISLIEGWNNHESIQYLELRKNKLKKLHGLKNLPKLIELYLSQNNISDLRGLENLPSLKKLYVRNNKIKKILKPFPFLPSLYHLNVRENQIENIEQFEKIDKHVRSITFNANPLAQALGQNAKKQIIWKYPHFERVNKGVVTLEQRLEFEKEWKQKLLEKERQRLQKLAQQQEARRAQEGNGQIKEQQ